MKSIENPLVIIGLDGCDWGLINPWMDKGKLPNLRKIKTEGISSDMVSTIPPLTAPALSSFMTGKNPDNTGITSFIKTNGGVISFNDIKEPCLWDYLGAVDIYSCVVGLRITYPPKKIKGIMLSEGMLCSTGKSYIQPEDYLDKCLGFQPDAATHPVLYKMMTKGVVENFRKFTDELISLTEKQFSVFTGFRNMRDFPFSLFYIENTDIIQHFCWHEPGEILRLYQCLDALIGRFLDENPDVNLILMSDHGFQAVPEQEFFINGWLAEKGYLRSSRHILKRKVNAALSCARRATSAMLSPMAKRRLRLFWEKYKSPKSVDGGHTIPTAAPLMKAARQCNFDPDSAIAYAFEPWGVRINTESGEVDCQAVGTKLISDMKALSDRDGKSIFSLICRKEEIYSGKYCKNMPDILFLVQGNFDVNTYTGSKCFGPYRNPQNTTGAHRQAYRGIMMAFGPGVAKSASMEQIRIIDFLPTILEYFNLALPGDLDGESRADIFRGSKSRRIKTEAKPTMDIQDSEAYTKDEESKIKERLRSLGYLE